MACWLVGKSLKAAPWESPQLQHLGCPLFVYSRCMYIIWYFPHLQEATRCPKHKYEEECICEEGSWHIQFLCFTDILIESKHQQYCDQWNTGILNPWGEAFDHKDSLMCISVVSSSDRAVIIPLDHTLRFSEGFRELAIDLLCCKWICLSEFCNLCFWCTIYGQVSNMQHRFSPNPLWYDPSIQQF